MPGGGIWENFQEGGGCGRRGGEGGLSQVREKCIATGGQCEGLGEVHMNG